MLYSGIKLWKYCPKNIRIMNARCVSPDFLNMPYGSRSSDKDRADSTERKELRISSLLAK